MAGAKLMPTRRPVGLQAWRGYAGTLLAQANVRLAAVRNLPRLRAVNDESEA